MHPVKARRLVRVRSCDLEIAMTRVQGVQSRGTNEILERIFIPAQLAEDESAIVERLGVTRLKADRLVHFLERFVAASEELVNDSKLLMKVRYVGPQTDRLPEIRERALGLIRRPVPAPTTAIRESVSGIEPDCFAVITVGALEVAELEVDV